MKIKDTLTAFADRYLVEDWRDCLNWLSVWVAGITGALAGLDAADVEFVQSLLPDHYALYAAGIFFLARVKGQSKAE